MSPANSAQLRQPSAAGGGKFNAPQRIPCRTPEDS